MKTKTYPRLWVTRRPPDAPGSTAPPWVLRVHRWSGRASGSAYDWGRYPTAQAAWDAAADILHNHWER